ncbi:phospholipase D-like domain-containing protein [Pseudoclavibacter sp. 13-3]|uniref:phospholipase D-like domain-containing protein n=1 Tax=Pseudoclavibacter sp. 13-3 TaxID=2901228 RepID=UPI001E4A3078|nr:phospholipase D-like domain-containing protein [Pseudoclavibacter sp. 13-3]MCD7100701.1 phospholipase D-like domain-containing protein [Pseudoclavibacter sp. 13-3]
MSAVQFVSSLALIAHILIVLVAAIAISLRRKPATAIAWILTIVFIPLVGVLGFLTVGVGRLPRWRRERQHEVNEMMLGRSGVAAHRVTPESPDWLATGLVLNERLGALPMVGGNRVRLIDDYHASFAAMAEDIDHAVDFVHVQFYILVHDSTTQPFFDALRRACARGVTVRVLSDHLSGFMYPHRRETQRLLSDMGAQYRPMLPLRPFSLQWQRPDLRNHRKVLVIDGAVAYTGSQNLIDESYLKPKNLRRGLHWHEVMMRAEGPLVAELDAVFVSDWYSESGHMLTPAAHGQARPASAAAALSRPDETSPAQSETPIALDGPSITEGPAGAEVAHVDAQVVPSGPSFENDNTLKLFVMLIQNARRRISIASPYFVPDESTLLALVTAASRGLDVELFVSEVGDQVFVHHAQRSYYAALLEAGVSIHLYRAPTVLHSKHFSIDDEVAVIGSSNMDIRSFSLNMEVSVLVRSRGFVDRLRLIEDSYRRNSRSLDLEQWNSRPLREKALDGIARLTSAVQ